MLTICSDRSMLGIPATHTVLHVLLSIPSVVCSRNLPHLLDLYTCSTHSTLPLLAPPTHCPPGLHHLLTDHFGKVDLYPDSWQLMSVHLVQHHTVAYDELKELRLREKIFPLVPEVNTHTLPPVSCTRTRTKHTVFRRRQ